ncbi:MAG: helix-turn-helix domain-containing protein [Coprobacillus sp.]|nr:helix-turn-helix domain-containing protein [Coprobacillus sp.]
MEETKKIIGENLSFLRKNAKITQQEIADMLGYTDKAVSSWEKGNALPDVETLVKLCEIYHVDFNYLLVPLDEHPRVSSLKEERSKLSEVQQALIIGIIIVAIWLIATVVYIYMRVYLPDTSGRWMAFIWSIPISFLITTIVIPIYYRGRHFLIFISSSLLTWTILLSICLQAGVLGYTVWFVMLLGLPIEVVFILWYLFRTGAHPFRNRRDKQKE